MDDFLDDFRATVAAESIRLMSLSDEAAGVPASAGKWSPKEVIGHLNEIAWRTVLRNEPVTLDYFIRDYLGHMKHHLAQVR